MCDVIVTYDVTSKSLKTVEFLSFECIWVHNQRLTYNKKTKGGIFQVAAQRNAYHEATSTLKTGGMSTERFKEKSLTRNQIKRSR